MEKVADSSAGRYRNEIAIVEQVRVSRRCQPGRPSRLACYFFPEAVNLSLVSGIFLQMLELDDSALVKEYVEHGSLSLGRRPLYALHITLHFVPHRFDCQLPS